MKTLITLFSTVSLLQTSALASNSGYIIECNPNFIYSQAIIDRATEKLGTETSKGVSANDLKNCKGYECGLWETYCQTAYCAENMEVRLCAWGRPVVTPWGNIADALKNLMGYCQRTGGSAWSTKGYYIVVQDNYTLQCGGPPNQPDPGPGPDHPPTRRR